MQYFVDLGSHDVNPLDPSTKVLEIDWTSVGTTDGTRIVDVWARPVSGNASITLRDLSPLLVAKADGTHVVWRMEWTTPGSAISTWELVGKMSDAVTQP